MSIREELEKKIKNRSAKISVIGLGYVGLPLAVEFAKNRYEVTGIDTDLDRVNNVKNGVPYILDVDVRDTKKLVASKKLIPTIDCRRLASSDVIIICVPTPLKGRGGKTPNINYIKGAVMQIKLHLHKGQLIVLESTTYPGTTDEVILPILESTGLKAGKDFFLVFSPERIDPGNEKFPFKKIPKVAGGITGESAELFKMLYETVIERVVIVSSPRAAETVKLLENTFRLVNIGLINEMAMMAHKMGLNIWEIVDAAKTKPFGFMPFYPGAGVGGHCIPKDPLYLYWKARHFGFKSRFIKLSSDLNSAMPDYVVSRIEEIKALKNLKVMVLGITYKKDIKDLRQSPALDIIKVLRARHAHTHYADPLIPYLKFGDIELKAFVLTPEVLKGMDCVIVATDHSAFDYNFILKNSNLIFDTRNVYKGVENKKIVRL